MATPTQQETAGGCGGPHENTVSFIPISSPKHHATPHHTNRKHPSSTQHVGDRSGHVSRGQGHLRECGRPHHARFRVFFSFQRASHSAKKVETEEGDYEFKSLNFRFIRAVVSVFLEEQSRPHLPPTDSAACPHIWQPPPSRKRREDAGGSVKSTARNCKLLPPPFPPSPTHITRPLAILIVCRVSQLKDFLA